MRATEAAAGERPLWESDPLMAHQSSVVRGSDSGAEPSKPPGCRSSCFGRKAAIRFAWKGALPQPALALRPMEERFRGTVQLPLVVPGERVGLTEFLHAGAEAPLLVHRDAGDM